MSGHEETQAFNPAGASETSPVPAHAPATAGELAAIAERLEQLEQRVLAFGTTGGDSVGDALRQGAYALACVRELAQGIARVTGSHIPLPVAPAAPAAAGGPAGPVPTVPASGVETMAGVAGLGG